MATKNLDDIFNQIIETMCESIEFNAYDDETSFSFCYDDNGYYIEGSGTVGGDWHIDGDGYLEPCEYYLKHGYGDLEKLNITHYDEVSGDDTKIAEDMVNKIHNRLDKALSEYMSNY